MRASQDRSRAVSRAVIALAAVTTCCMTVYAKDEKPKSVPIDFTMKCNVDKDGKTMPEGQFEEGKAWETSDFYGQGKVTLEGDTVVIGTGNDMTGIRWKGPLAKMNYEITLEAKRVEGSDFFCGLTFPYNDDFCSLILGGWGGRLVGLSSFDHMDASENGSATWRDFENGKWYSIRLRVTPKKIEAWIDEENVIDESTEGRKIGIRWEVEKSCPLGIATWQTTGAIRNVRLRAFPAAAQP
ncbi:MAG: DUF1080 domain-containing protein [Candidatus Hydrogenedentes bacterium]|nr:DUF1080 domain-containing protein [Candidatus Hydrogenedentota bacterium]